MRSSFMLLALVCMILATTRAQNAPPSVSIGDTAPPLRLKAWLKGKPVKRFEKGNVYVVEFWATWCKPCIAAMPHLSALASEYKDRVTFLGIDIYEKKTTSIKNVQAFVDSMGQRMDYQVAAEDSNFMEVDWLIATGEKDNGIPATFVVNGEGRLAWIGHPKDLDEVLPEIVNNTWDISQALAKKNENRRLKELDHSAYYELMYGSNGYERSEHWKPDSTLLVINEIVGKEPKLKYAAWITFFTFSSLLKTNPNKAYEYGKEVLVIPAHEEPAYDMIINSIKSYSDKLNLPPEIYQLGAEAYQLEINQFPYPELVNMSMYYNNMANMYWRGKNKIKAIDAQQKAIKALKSKKNFSATDMAAFEYRLKQYKNM